MLVFWAAQTVKGFPGGSTGKDSACNVGDLGSIPGLGRSLGEGKGFPLQYSGLENSMDYILQGTAKSETWLSDFHFQTVKNLPSTGGDSGSIPGSVRYPGEGNSYPLHYSCLESSIDRGAWQAIVHGVTKSLKAFTLLSFTILYITPQIILFYIGRFVLFDALHTIHPPHIWQQPICFLYLWTWMSLLLNKYSMMPLKCGITHYLSFFIWFISLSIMLLRSTPCCCKWHDFIIFWGWIILCCSVCMCV